MSFEANNGNSNLPRPERHTSGQLFGLVVAIVVLLALSLVTLALACLSLLERLNGTVNSSYSEGLLAFGLVTGLVGLGLGYVGRHHNANKA